jgi:quercetin dioxygenase-like cupin family protein
MEGRVFDFTEVKENLVEMEGASSAYIRWLLGPSDGVPNFYLRMFRLEKGGHTPYHLHPYEHEVFVIRGKGTVKIGNKDFSLKGGSVAFVPPNEMHQFMADGGEELVFLCIIPKT